MGVDHVGVDDGTWKDPPHRRDMILGVPEEPPAGTRRNADPA